MISQPQFTKQQITRIIFTGDADLPVPVDKSMYDYAGIGTRGIDYAIQHNPTDVYAFIKANYGNNYPNYLPGVEFNPTAQQGMSKYLLGQYNLLDSNDKKLLFIHNLFASVKSTPKIKNWTTPIN